MSRICGSILVGAALSVTLSGLARAENEGQEDLDRATEAKLAAVSLEDLGKVIELCRSSLDKGLTEANTQFANLMLASTLAQRGQIRAKRISMVLATDPKVAGLRKAALDDLEDAVRLDPKQFQSLFYIAQLNRLPGGDTARAKKALDQAIALDSDDAAFQAKALVLRAVLGTDLDKRQADLDEAVRIAPDYAAALHFRGLFYASLGKSEQALADLGKAAELAPGHVPSHEALAILLAGLEKYDESLVALDKALELVPNSIALLLKKAAVHAAQDNLDAALIDLRLAESIEPDNMDVRMTRGGVYQQMEKFPQAVEDFSAVLAKQPDHWPALRNRGDALLNLGKHEQAVADYEKALKLQAKSSGALNNLAWVLATSPNDGLRDGKRAVELAKKACQLTDYKLPHILSTLAAANAETGDFASAVKWIEKGLEIADDDEIIEPLKKELESYREGKPWREMLAEQPPDGN